MTVSPLGLCQIEIQVSDLAASLEFYDKVFGWPAVPAEIHGVTILQVPEECPFGISLVTGRHDASVQKGRIVLYFAVDDPKSVADRGGMYGGRLRFGPKKLAGYGTIYQLEDPAGIRWGLFKKAVTPPLAQ